MENILQQLIDLLKNIAPEIWETLIRQVYVEAFVKLVWALFFATITAALYKFVSSERLKYEAEYDDGKFIQDGDFSWVYIPTFFGFLLTLLLLISSLMWFSNPEFYAIRYLIEQIR